MKIPDLDAHAAALSSPVETSSMTVTPKREIAFIDCGVDDLATLLAGIRPDVEPIHAEQPRELINCRREVTQQAIMPILRHCKPGTRETTEALSE
jgi:hypothetical protein